MRRSPFSLYKYSTKSAVIWYARFYDESGKVYATRSTGIPCTEDSPYVRAKRIVEKKPLSRKYVELNDFGNQSELNSQAEDRKRNP